VQTVESRRFQLNLGQLPGRTASGALVTIIDITQASGGTFGHELAHHVLGDTTGAADRAINWLGSKDPALGLMVGWATNVALTFETMLYACSERNTIPELVG
jgi:hypothetical protein